MAAALRLLLPYRLVMIFSAYRLADDVAALTHVPRHGAATLVLHRLGFAAFGPDHRTMVAVHTALGLLTIPVLLAWLARLRPPAGTVALAAAGLACTPVFVLDHRTESVLVAGFFFLAAGLLLLDAALRPAPGRTGRLDLVGAVAFLALAMTSRPELTLVTPVLLAVVLWLRRPPVDLRLPLGLAGLALALAVVPHLLHLRHAARVEAAAGSLPELSPGFFVDALPRLATLALPLQPELFPMGYSLAALLGLALRDGRKWRLALLILALGWMTLTLADLPRTSVPRLHAPAGALVTLVAAWSLAAAWQRWRHVRRARLLAGVTLALMLGSVVPSARALWPPQNEDATEAFLQAALPLLPARDACLVHLGYEDPPAPGRTQRAFPGYLLRLPWREVREQTVTEWRQAGQPTCPAGTFFVVDHRCYALHDDAEQPGARGPDGMLASCRAVLDGHAWRPVLERDVPNRGDNEYGYYPAVGRFRLGLYALAAER